MGSKPSVKGIVCALALCLVACSDQTGDAPSVGLGPGGGTNSGGGGGGAGGGCPDCGVAPVSSLVLFAGDNSAPAGSNDGLGRAAHFDQPDGIAADAAGNVFVADTANHTIRKITSDGVVTTLAGAAGEPGSTDATGAMARFFGPEAVATSGTNVFVGDGLNHTVRSVSSLGAVATRAGTAGISGSLDGTGAAASFDLPRGAGTDAVGNVYVADAVNHTLRKITPTGVVTTLAGLANAPGSVDGSGPLARFDSPSGVAADGAGNLYVADTNNHTIRKITQAGVVTTLAGAASQIGSTDGTGAAARFAFPRGLAVDGSGNLYVADSGNDTVRKITPAGAVTTVAGRAGQAGFQLGTVPGMLNGPFGVAISGSSLYIVMPSCNCVVVLENRP
jgi:sugar lactone lactonase YvrE